ncbi:DUF1559 domain-containing protein [Rhodopirellula sp.]|nr:DUF1559 domain-containing protein [Rhodopirellula sp.]
MAKFSGCESIVAILAALAVMSLFAMSIPRQRITTRGNQCSADMKNVALATIQYDSSQTYLPGYTQDFGTYSADELAQSAPTNQGIPRHKKIGTWAVAILPWLDAQPTYERWTQDRYPIIVADPSNPPQLGATTGSAGEGFHSLASPHLSIFPCPANAVNESPNAPNNMIYNNGLAWPANGTPFAVAQNIDNGVGQNKYNVTVVDRTTGRGTHTTEGPNITLNDFTDGQSCTILFSENIQALPWHRAGLIDSADLILKDPNQQDIVFDLEKPNVLAARYVHGMVWHYEDAEHTNTKLANQWNKLGTTTPIAPMGVAAVHRINGCMSRNKNSLFNLRIRNANNAVHLARPSSAHPNGVNTAFADGSTRWTNENIDYRVYQAFMTPSGKTSSVPLPKFVLPPQFRN